MVEFQNRTHLGETDSEIDTNGVPTISKRTKKCENSPFSAFTPSLILFIYNSHSLIFETP